MAHLSLSLLGPLQVLLDEEPVTAFESDKVRALLAYLAVEAERPQRRQHLAGLLWPDWPERRARRNLSQALFNLRHAIGDHDANPPFLYISRTTIQFNRSSDCWLDAAAFTALLTACDTHPHRRIEDCDACLERLREAVSLYRGRFLVGFSVGDSPAFEEWAVLERERLQSRIMGALQSLAAHHEQRGRYEAALPYARRQIVLEPWREEAHRQTMRLLARSGQRGAALAQYETCRQALAEELGVEPSPETTALYERVRAAPEPSHNLPPQPTGFIGREEELAAMGRRLADPECRLLTVVGAGGIGKTRLTLETASRHRHAFLHGVYFVPLASADASEHVVPTIADALDFTFHGQKEPKEQLLSYLREKELLLVLDNFEHLLDGGVDLVLEILEAAPDVKLLVTSRERLNVQWEWLVEIEGLTYPPPPSPPPHRGRVWEGVDVALEDYSAVQLFLDRARRVHWDLSPAKEARWVVRICQLA